MSKKTNGSVTVGRGTEAAEFTPTDVPMLAGFAAMNEDGARVSALCSAFMLATTSELRRAVLAEAVLEFCAVQCESPDEVREAFDITHGFAARHTDPRCIVSHKWECPEPGDEALTCLDCARVLPFFTITDSIEEDVRRRFGDRFGKDMASYMRERLRAALKPFRAAWAEGYRVGPRGWARGSTVPSLGG